MDFLWIKQVLGLFLHIKIYFLNYFISFLTVWTRPQFPESAGTLVQDSTDSVNSAPRTAGSIFLIPEDSLTKLPSRRGTAGSGPFDPTQRLRLNLSRGEPVRYAARWIGNLRSALNITEIEAQPVGSRINGRGSFYLNDTHSPNLSRSL